MAIYLIALPIWNFVLPVYAFSKFDDFSWGETRKVEGEVKGDNDHGGGGGIAIDVPLRRWEDWERSRIKKIKRDEKRRREFEKTFGSRHFYGESTYEDSLAPSGSDSASMLSHDDDRWGMQIGAYKEDGPTALPPPVGLYHVDDAQSEAHETLEAGQMELVLEQGWADESSPPGDRDYAAAYKGDYGRTGRDTPTSPSLSVPPIQTRYSLNDTPQARFYPASSQQLHPSSSTSSLASNDTYSPLGYPAQTSLYASDSRLPLVAQQQSPGMSSAVERGTRHAKQRSIGGSPELDRRGENEDRGNTPSPSKGRYHDRDQSYGQSRR